MTKNKINFQSFEIEKVKIFLKENGITEGKLSKSYYELERNRQYFHIDSVYYSEEEREFRSSERNYINVEDFDYLNLLSYYRNSIYTFEFEGEVGEFPKRNILLFEEMENLLLQDNESIQLSIYDINLNLENIESRKNQSRLTTFLNNKISIQKKKKEISRILKSKYLKEKLRKIIEIRKKVFYEPKLFESKNCKDCKEHKDCKYSKEGRECIDCEHYKEKKECKYYEECKPCETCKNLPKIVVELEENIELEISKEELEINKRIVVIFLYNYLLLEGFKKKNKKNFLKTVKELLKFKKELKKHKSQLSEEILDFIFGNEKDLNTQMIFFRNSFSLAVFYYIRVLEKLKDAKCKLGGDKNLNGYLTAGSEKFISKVKITDYCKKLKEKKEEIRQLYNCFLVEYDKWIKEKKDIINGREILEFEEEIINSGCIDMVINNKRVKKVRFSPYDNRKDLIIGEVYYIRKLEPKDILEEIDKEVDSEMEETLVRTFDDLKIVIGNRIIKNENILKDIFETEIIKEKYYNYKTLYESLEKILKFYKSGIENYTGVYSGKIEENLYIFKNENHFFKELILKKYEFKVKGIVVGYILENE